MTEDEKLMVAKLEEIFEKEDRPLTEEELIEILKNYGLDKSILSKGDKVYFWKVKTSFDPDLPTGFPKDRVADDVLFLYFPEKKFVSFIKMATKKILSEQGKKTFYGFTFSNPLKYSITLSDLVSEITKKFIASYGLGKKNTSLISNPEKLYFSPIHEPIVIECKAEDESYCDYIYVFTEAEEERFFENWNEIINICCSDIVVSSIHDNKLYFSLKSQLPSPQKLLRDRIKSILSDQPLILEELRFEINSSEDIPGIEKPVSAALIKNVLEMNIDLFFFDENNDIVRLLTDDEFLEYVKERLKNDTTLISKLPESFNEDGIVALLFIGNQFSLEEAKEYVNVRPIIFVTNVDNDVEIKKLLSIDDMKIDDPEESDLRFLKTIIPKDVDSFDWMKNNLAVSFVKCSKERLKIILPKLIKSISPIFNFTHNPQNLFESIIKAKAAEIAGNQKNVEK